MSTDTSVIDLSSYNIHGVFAELSINPQSQPIVAHCLKLLHNQIDEETRKLYYNEDRKTCSETAMEDTLHQVAQRYWLLQEFREDFSKEGLDHDALLVAALLDEDYENVREFGELDPLSGLVEGMPLSERTEILLSEEILFKAQLRTVKRAKACDEVVLLAMFNVVDALQNIISEFDSYDLEEIWALLEDDIPLAESVVKAGNGTKMAEEAWLLSQKLKQDCFACIANHAKNDNQPVLA